MNGGSGCASCGYSVDWHRYIKGESLSSEKETAEERLARCESCMDDYIFAVGELRIADADNVKPEARLDESWVDRTMTAVRLAEAARQSLGDGPHAGPAEAAASDSALEAAARRSSAGRRNGSSSGRELWRRRAAVHYAVAVGLTLVLLLTGGFHQLTGLNKPYAEQDRAEARESGGEPEASWSDRMVDRTVAWLDKLQK